MTISATASVVVFFFLYLSFSSSNVYGHEETTTTTSKTTDNPFTAKASLIRYWNQHVSKDVPKPPFLISKASPLNAVHFARLTRLAATKNALSSNLDAFCSLANLLCSFDSKQPEDAVTRRGRDADFAVYNSKSFANYGQSRLGGVDSFKNYSDGLNIVADSFKKYSGETTGHSEDFTSYARNGNVAAGNFTSYASSSNGGSGEFTSYGKLVNKPGLRFASYNSDGNNHKLGFSSYSSETNSGEQSFISYGKNGNAGPTEFTAYADNSNVIGSTFTGYGELGNAANNTFKSYGESGNDPRNNFRSYGIGANTAVSSFTGYRDEANVGQDSFQTYSRNSNSGQVRFANYGRTFNDGNDTFKEYGKGSVGRTTVGFKSYDKGRTFKDYANNGVTFAGYVNASDGSSASRKSGISVNRFVEPGKFFRESMLKEGNVMVMPDIRDKLPKRSFLPRAILSKLPFSTSHLSELKEIFHASDHSSMERVISNALTECERAPSQGETKRCVGSIEDMIDFATSVLATRSVVPRTTENVNGSNRKIMVKKVRGINGGGVTKSVSCHQSLYPYLLYYCHSVPRVRVYEADIAEVESREKINRGVAICHLDTSAWSPGHGAFIALGSGPGKIEVCHWIFENDMTWTIAD